mmetsp:Transcript_10749/g.40219  ORF Transcript_10749/g.40219 Transcript_10749/m.40219 type:complete len:314 (-) Transcript_10749:1121-2062(-)|eukprot:CAMPEP_0117437894 /NCGR_PEP_ID=MMETSP0759-20121206/1767_1 /TAXON_ID=63605 /ORGANISM="Percolomonas cosmopolitus, Strain WS" /LENGTH=313 /DNA_ID=CAMNT_0005229557 /DNA_START=620 /DNA_END=1561 /DNA_ORIENTATION=-
MSSGSFNPISSKHASLSSSSSSSLNSSVSSTTKSSFLTSKKESYTTSNSQHLSQFDEQKDKQKENIIVDYSRDLFSFDFRQLLEWEYDPNDFDPFEFIANVPDKETLPNHLKVKKICIPKKSLMTPRVTLVLDLDETLVHCSTVPIKKADFVFPVNFNNTEYQVYVRKRPYFELFLQECCKMFEVVVFTASHSVYASKLLDLLDKNRQWIHHRAYRDSCLPVEGNYLKDLCVLGRNLATTCIIDNSPQAYAYQLHNGIPIHSWYEDENDDELLRLLPFLKILSQSDDVRPLIRQKFKFYEIINAYTKQKKIRR